MELDAGMDLLDRQFKASGEQLSVLESLLFNRQIDMNAVPCREEGMTPYEMMLSESQERMLMVLKPGREAEAEAIFRKWELDFAVIGRVTETGHMVLKWNGETVCDICILARER